MAVSIFFINVCFPQLQMVILKAFSDAKEIRDWIVNINRFVYLLIIRSSFPEMELLDLFLSILLDKCNYVIQEIPGEDDGNLVIIIKQYRIAIHES